MAATGLNHVSVVASELEESIRFYEDVFGARRVPTPNFGFPVQWLAVGSTQLHLFERPDGAPVYHHFALSVDDLPATFAALRDRAAFDHETFGHHLYELPNDIAQLYARDPAGNLVEVDALGAGALPEDIAREMKPLSDGRPQDEENLRATLFGA
jgi:catechol 2,3-dioxygenase-like lactoylglutathione lyase family enzyme